AISTDFGSWEGSWSAWMPVIFPPLIVTFSWTLPYWVETASLVTVFVDDENFGGDAAVVVVTAVAAGAFEWGLNPSVAARPAAVAARTTGARLTGRRTRGGRGYRVLLPRVRPR